MTVITGLYVPGDRPDRFDKAVATGADLLILDLEDAVAERAKPAALDHVSSWLQNRLNGGSRSNPVIQVRVNAGADQEVIALRDLGVAVEIRLPKVERVEELSRVAKLAGNLPITALIESARGIQNAASIADHAAVTRLALGDSDLASDLGSRDDLVLDFARCQLLVAARAAGLPAPMLSAYPDLQNLEGLRADTARGKRLGLVGRVAVHPRQLDIIKEIFAATPAEVDWAKAVLAVVNGGGVATLPNGEMVDPAMAGRARSILDR
jgi:citrate lyase subunit beta/citryl-CoA lyase